jgi:hypothetical protein
MLKPEHSREALLLALLTGSAVRVCYPVERRGMGDMDTFAYYVAKTGPFTIIDEKYDYEYQFDGNYFECLGSTYFANVRGAQVGWEIFDQPYELIKLEDVPKLL